MRADTLNILPHGAQCVPQPGSSVKGPDLKGFKQYVRISWSIPKALDKGFQRLLRPPRVPQGNIDWYEKWYELQSLPRRPADRILTPIVVVKYPKVAGNLPATFVSH